MTTLTRLLAETWSLFRCEADLIVRIVAPLVFFPEFAVKLLTEPPPSLAPTRDQAVIDKWMNLFSDWVGTYGGWLVLASLVGLFGLTTLAVLLVDRTRPHVRASLADAARLLPRFVLASLLVAVPVSLCLSLAVLGLWLFVLPGLYAQARLIAVLPALVAERPLGAARSLSRSVAITRGHGWALLGAVLTFFLLEWLAMGLLAPLDDWLRKPAHLNPFLLALVDAAMAAVAAAYHVAILLLGVVAYRRLASKGT